jgi:Circadian oscillating protein COP23
MNYVSEHCKELILLAANQVELLSKDFAMTSLVRLNSHAIKKTVKTMKTLGLSCTAVLLSSSMLGAFSPAQALPGWLQLTNRNSNATNSSVTAQRSTNSTTTTPSTSTTTQNQNNVRFSCQVVNGQYTVMYNPQSQPGQYYAWATPTALGGGWTPERRCNEISRRLETYRPDGLLELKTGFENRLETVCVTTEDNPACRIVLTVPPGQSAVAVRDRIFNNLLVADSGQQTTAAVAYQDNGSGILTQIGQAIGVDLSGLSGRPRSTSPAAINLRPFLDTADGGTGARLQTSTQSPTQTPAVQSPAPTGGTPRLNPGNFR